MKIPRRKKLQCAADILRLLLEIPFMCSKLFNTHEVSEEWEKNKTNFH
jgi:hypothetical protein